MPPPLPRTRWRRSLVARLAALWAILIALAVGTFGYFLYHGAKENLTDTLRASLEHGAEGALVRLDAWARALQEDARFLSNSPVVHRFIRRRGSEEGDAWRALAEAEFRALLAGKPSYFQVRLIDLNDGGRELVRLERRGEDVHITPEFRLQEKGGRDYVREAAVWLERNPSGIYLSEINLNQEFGEISLPHTPTLRAVATVDGAPEILVVINSDLRPLLDQLRSGIAPDAEVRMAGERGDYLAHPDPRLEFGADLGGGARLAADFPGAERLPPGGSWISSNGDASALAFAVRTAVGDTPPRPVTLVASLPSSAWLPKLEALRVRAASAALAAAALGAVAVFALSRPMVHRLQRLSAAIQAYDTGASAPLDLPADRDDEVGVVAQRFRQLDAKVRAQVASLEAARREAVAAKDAKEEFLAVMSHEIRTPMNAVIGMIRALEANRPGDHQAPMLRTLRASASNLLALLNSALDYTKLRGGQLAFQEEDFDPSEAVREVAQAHSPAAIQKGLNLDATVAEGVPPTVRGDPVRLRQILHNLVANAVKFSAHGSVVLTCGPMADGWLRFVVSDTGRGISPEDRERIFAPFEQAGARPADEPGAGLGLAIARALVERQGGRLTLQSEPGTGSRFTVELPFGRPRHGRASVREAKVAADGALRGARLLYVEDVASNRSVLEASLGGTGAEIAFAGSGAEALEAVREGAFDLALLDLKLPDTEGDILAAQLRVLAPTLPLMAVTAQAGGAARERCRAAGIAGFLLKPYEPETLRAEILRLLGQPPAGPGDDAVLRELFPDPARRAQHLALLAGELRKAADELPEGDPAQIRHRLTTALSQLGLAALAADLHRLRSEDAPWLRQRCAHQLRQCAGRILS